ncbi:MAG: hypothetical protein B6U88_01845 [Candidatus Aenigmarchaeota archaeon ex4484_56]|nr:MAG: hypothetical protein B6U88_01845 [Candidatus Aenigmarchaeota archaeon ex4484_56]
MLEDKFRKAYLTYGEIARKILPKFPHLRENLRRSGLKYTPEEYLSFSIFISIVIYACEIPIITFVLSFFIHVLLSIILSFVISTVFSIIIFIVCINYPKARISNLADKIDKGLPFCVSYMAATASSGTSPVEIFKSVVNLKEYPELGEQAKSIVRNVESLGMTILTALRYEIKKTPSRAFKDLLSGIEATIRSGGDLESFLTSRAELLFNNYQRKIKIYSDLLSMLVETYLTVVIVGSIFFTILSSIMAIIGGAGDILSMQVLVVYILMPGISLIFSVYLKISTP